MTLEHLNLTSSLTQTCFALLIALPLGCDSSNGKPEGTEAAKSEPASTKKDEPKDPKPEAVAPTPPAKPAEPDPAPSKPVPVAFAKTQPCTITTKSTDPKANLECFEIRALHVAGHAQRICFPIPEPYTLKYDDQGRILDDGLYSYKYGADGSAESTWIGDGKPTTSEVKFDAVGRMTELNATDVLDMLADVTGVAIGLACAQAWSRRERPSAVQKNEGRSSRTADGLAHVLPRSERPRKTEGRCDAWRASRRRNWGSAAPAKNTRGQPDAGSASSRKTV